jgi:HPt (histidine-containing phosphotransfer) domain-containing protein
VLPRNVEGAAPAPKAGDVLDRQVLAELSRMLGNGQPALLASLINLYLVESPRLMDELKRAARAGDTRQIAHSAHSLKSCSANVGAMVLSRYCADVEASAKRADTEEARRILPKLESEHDSVQAALSTEFDLLSSGKA